MSDDLLRRLKNWYDSGDYDGSIWDEVDLALIGDAPKACIIPEGTILHCEVTGVVLQFRGDGKGYTNITIWRKPDHERPHDGAFNCESYGLQDGEQQDHGVFVRECPLPGPHLSRPQQGHESGEGT